VLAGDFFFVEVGRRRPVVDFAEAVHGARREEHGRGELRLAASAVSDESHVPDRSGVIDLHKGQPPEGKGQRSL
jgi:hypothetical protein